MPAERNVGRGYYEVLWSLDENSVRVNPIVECLPDINIDLFNATAVIPGSLPESGWVGALQP
jgi:hypothetical protein